MYSSSFLARRGRHRVNRVSIDHSVYSFSLSLACVLVVPSFASRLVSPSSVSHRSPSSLNYLDDISHSRGRYLSYSGQRFHERKCRNDASLSYFRTEEDNTRRDLIYWMSKWCTDPALLYQFNLIHHMKSTQKIIWDNFGGLLVPLEIRGKQITAGREGSIHVNIFDRG